MRMQQEVQIKVSSLSPKRWKQPKGEDRNEMKREVRVLRCTLLYKATWSAEKNA